MYMMLSMSWYLLRALSGLALSEVWGDLQGEPSSPEAPWAQATVPRRARDPRKLGPPTGGWMCGCKRPSWGQGSQSEVSSSQKPVAPTHRGQVTLRVSQHLPGGTWIRGEERVENFYYFKSVRNRFTLMFIHDEKNLSLDMNFNLWENC